MQSEEAQLDAFIQNHEHEIQNSQDLNQFVSDIIEAEELRKKPKSKPSNIKF